MPAEVIPNFSNRFLGCKIAEIDALASACKDTVCGDILMVFFRFSKWQFFEAFLGRFCVKKVTVSKGKLRYWSRNKI